MGAWLLYWWDIFLLTKDRIKDHWRTILFAYLCLPIADIFHYYNFGRTRASHEFDDMTITQIIPFTLGGIFLTIFYMFFIGPYRLHQQKIETIKNLSDDVKQYEDRTTPKVEFIFEEDKPPYKILDAGTPDKGIWKCRVSVQSKWHELLTDCAVILEAVSPSSERFIARKLKLASDNPADVLNTPCKQSFSLTPGGKELIDVVQVDMRPEANQVRLYIATEGHRDLQTDVHLPRGNYVFTLKAEAHVGNAAYESFVLETNHPPEPKFFRLKT